MKKRNNNCLEGMRCPKCGALEPFCIVVVAFAKVWDSGTDKVSDIDWDINSHCRCVSCNHSGIVKDFYNNKQRKRNDRI